MKDCDREVLDDLNMLKTTITEAATEAGATVLGESFHQFNPHGVSGAVLIAESHIFIHTWPECGYAAVDIFTCGDSVQPSKAAQMLVNRLGAKNHSMLEIQRGILDTD